MKTFVLNRKEDISGVSGTGVVAEGVEFIGGMCAIHWLGRYSTVEICQSMDDLKAVHGHEGRTEIIWTGEI